jgi:hypothetical protein
MMRFTSWLGFRWTPSPRAGGGHARGSGRPAPASTRVPSVEPLEARALPSFLAPLAFDAGNSPQSVAVGEFNGDTIPDLAVANGPEGQPGTVSALLGNSDGSFQAARSFSAGGRPWSVAVGEFDQDGLLDLAVANRDSANGGRLGTVHASPSTPISSETNVPATASRGRPRLRGTGRALGWCKSRWWDHF